MQLGLEKCITKFPQFRMRNCITFSIRKQTRPDQNKTRNMLEFQLYNSYVTGNVSSEHENQDLSPENSQVSTNIKLTFVSEAVSLLRNRGWSIAQSFFLLLI